MYKSIRANIVPIPFDMIQKTYEKVGLKIVFAIG